MRYIYLLSLLIFVSFVCCNHRNVKHGNENPLVVNDSVIDIVDIEEEPDTIPIKEGRKIRYLFMANGGIIAYFDDGTVVGCPRCELDVEALYNLKPHSTYIVEEDGILLVGGQRREIPFIARKGEWQDWIMIDYKWIEDSDREE